MIRYLSYFAALALTQRFVRSGDYVRSTLAAIRLLILFLKELVVANVQSIPGITRTLTCPVVHI